MWYRISWYDFSIGLFTLSGFGQLILLLLYSIYGPGLCVLRAFVSSIVGDLYILCWPIYLELVFLSGTISFWGVLLLVVRGVLFGLYMWLLVFLSLYCG